MQITIWRYIQMKIKRASAYLSHRFWPLEVILGIVLLCLVFGITANTDISNASERLYSTANYVKEQCNNNQKMDMASETKSLMRIMESAEYIDRMLSADMEKGSLEEPDESMLEAYARESYVTGILLLDPDGTVEQYYYTDELNAGDLQENIDAEALLDVWDFPEKTYAARVNCADGSYIDLAAVGRTDKSGIVVAYYHTPKEYCHIFARSMEQLLTGYTVEHDGTIVISSGEKIVASNDSELVGTSIDDNEILRTIRERAEGAKLVHTRNGDTTQVRSFGLMEQSRNYYIYAYMSERAVYNKTPQKMLFVALAYLFVLIIINMVRWRTTQKYQKQKIQMQQEYAQRLESKNLQLEDSVKRETKANSAKTDFLSRMTHDIRTSLNGIIGLLKIDEAHPDDLDLIHENRKKMLVSASHLLSLIDDMQMIHTEHTEEKASIEGLKLLLAEDNELNAEIAEMLLKDEGASVEVVRDGQQAIDAFAGHPQGTYDAILMDIMMPKVDGYTATKVIRSTNRPDAKVIPIIAMTANAFDEDAKQCLEAGMNAHLSKPLQMEKVVSTIARFCKRN